VAEGYSETKLLERDYGRAVDEGVSAREEGEGGYGGFDLPPVLTYLLRLHLAKHL
jgi:hypothetical protein